MNMKAYEYAVILHPDPHGGFAVSVPAFPEIATQGETVEEAIAMAKDAIQLYLDFLKERGEPIPAEKAHPQAIVVDVAA
jgi:predicted RNase H-like HicB family nuclease